MAAGEAFDDGGEVHRRLGRDGHVGNAPALAPLLEGGDALVDRAGESVGRRQGLLDTEPRTARGVVTVKS